MATIVVYAAAGWAPMTDLFFWLGTTGGSGILLLLAGTSVAIITFFARNPHDENVWSRLIAPALAMILLTGIVVLAVLYYGILLGVPAGSPAARALPGLYVVITGIGLAWGLILVRAFPHWAIWQPFAGGVRTAVRPARSRPPGPELPMVWVRAAAAGELADMMWRAETQVAPRGSQPGWP